MMSHMLAVHLKDSKGRAEAEGIPNGPMAIIPGNAHISICGVE